MVAALLPILALVACARDVDGSTQFVGATGPVGDYAVPVGSVIGQRFDGVVRQQFDFSCGSAALATLLRYHYDFDVREATVFRGMWARGDQAQIRRLGFSLLDMKSWLASRGLTADGYKVPLDKIAETGIPGIALIAVKNYRHFVVVKGMSATEVLLGDPSIGLTVVSRPEFEAAWNGIYFVLTEDQAVARSHFNRMQQWAAFARAPIAGRFADPISQQALSLTAPAYNDIR